MHKKNNLLIGAHMSIAGGLYKAIERGESIGCTAIQIFISSNRQWHMKTLVEKDIQNFKDTQQQNNILVVTHANYLINLASERPDIVDKSIEALKTQLNQCEELGIPYLVLHPGSGNPTEEAIKKVGTQLNKILKNFSGKTMLLLELMAGQGSVIGSTFEQLAQIREYIDSKIGFCIDTCHAWAAGYDLSTEESYDKVWKNCDNTLGLENIKVLHVNGSLKPLGSHVDRHADLDKGTMGLTPFKLLMNDKRFVHIPKILETPNETLEEYKRNMDILENLIGS